MPQATSSLQERWHGCGDGMPAWRQLGWHGNITPYLSCRFTDEDGLITPRLGVMPTADDLSAIDYLIQEWDYGYDENQAVDNREFENSLRNLIKIHGEKC